MSKDSVMQEFTMFFRRGVTGANNPGVFLCNPMDDPIFWFLTFNF